MLTGFTISERLLQFIWQFQYFNTRELQTVEGEPLSVIYPGRFNTNQGPDFLEAKIKIGNTTGAGNIELHVNASQWHTHEHGNDLNYANVILHVVWEQDEHIRDNNGNVFAALELQSRVSRIMLVQYEQLMQSQGFVACEKQLPALSNIAWLSWKERLVAERLEHKSAFILDMLQQSNHHWEELFWWLLARNFGIIVNAELFEQMARSISINILAKHKNQLQQLEALLLGQAGLLQQNFEEYYPRMLQREYLFLQKKYQLHAATVQPAFLRMRPANFPTIRLAQLAVMVHQSSHLFSRIKEIDDLAEVKKLLDVRANDYWHYHYRFNDSAAYKPKNLGSQMIDRIIINTIVPVLFSYGLYNHEQACTNKAIQWLNHLEPEYNAVTKAWKKAGITNSNAFDSQALLELKKHYCDEKRCLDCAVGNKLLKS